MIELYLIGIGTGNPDHLTRQAIKALNRVDLILIPHKGGDKADLAELRHTIIDDVVDNPNLKVVEFDLPPRDPSISDYLTRVDLWHDMIADLWAENITAHLGTTGKVALLIWGDPSLYDSTLRIADRFTPTPKIEVIPGITSIQALTAAHIIPLNTVNGPVMITTGRQLRDNGFPDEADNCVVMLDGECSFQYLDPQKFYIWWTAYAGMAQEIIESGPLSYIGPKIIKRRAEARARHGWIMDIYMLRYMHE